MAALADWEICSLTQNVAITKKHTQKTEQLSIGYMNMKLFWKPDSVTLVRDMLKHSDRSDIG